MVRMNKAHWVASDFVYQDPTAEECTLHCREGLSSRRVKMYLGTITAEVTPNINERVTSVISELKHG